MLRLALALSLTAAALLTPTVDALARDEGSPGARTLGDRLFPELGNGGYDVLDYDVSMSYVDGSQLMPASVTVRAKATQNLSALSLDAAAQQIKAVTVDGRRAEFRQEKEKLLLGPAKVLRAGELFTIQVDYTADRGQHPTPPGISLPPGMQWPMRAWVETPDGFAVMGQPDRAHLFFPNNDHPSDKAKFTFRLTAPNDRTAVANGDLVTKEPHPDGTTTWTYHTDRPMPTHVVQLAVGRFRGITQAGPNNLPIRSYLSTAPFQGKDLTADMERTARETPDHLAWLAKELGPYPFTGYGVLGLSSTYNSVALETATLSTYGAGLSLPPKDQAPTLVHELTHQYFGDAVSVATWDDMWLSEGHARFYERRYAASRGWIDLEKELKSLYQSDQKNRTTIGSAGHLKNPYSVLFDTNVPGQLMLEGLHTLVGPDTFRRIEQTFLNRYQHKSASTQDYITVTNEISGQNLTDYFHRWLYSDTTPPMPGRPDWTT
ncbi:MULTISPECIES: M1 family metallopeptidase [unclassified Crossiella]|uniref:M1 family metallopeptidase n=1 Tax=unclassified Crossiella TaxID=2620835 RepID=UPI001FFFE675|nr:MULTISPECIES: M1 family metallopeptidase [unclassified Crossiella]MCK2244156.1 M1 family metallopeptidase [Crossiella sp. S99.2]MCK2257960.1 M1 family metallopeptidase [Crossiella sp. S99.1]